MSDAVDVALKPGAEVLGRLLSGLADRRPVIVVDQGGVPRRDRPYEGDLTVFRMLAREVASDLRAEGALCRDLRRHELRQLASDLNLVFARTPGVDLVHARRTAVEFVRDESFPRTFLRPSERDLFLPRRPPPVEVDVAKLAAPTTVDVETSSATDDVEELAAHTDAEHVGSALRGLSLGVVRLAALLHPPTDRARWDEELRNELFDIPRSQQAGHASRVLWASIASLWRDR